MSFRPRTDDAEIRQAGTPIDLAGLLKINKPAVRVRYAMEEMGKPDLETVLDKFSADRGSK